jgi:hypothetical protein
MHQQAWPPGLQVYKCEAGGSNRVCEKFQNLTTDSENIGARIIQAMKVTTTEVDGSAVAQNQKRGKEGRRGEAAGDP